MRSKIPFKRAVSRDELRSAMSLESAVEVG